jgi:hypothetical protein
MLGIILVLVIVGGVVEDTVVATHTRLERLTLCGMVGGLCTLCQQSTSAGRIPTGGLCIMKITPYRQDVRSAGMQSFMSVIMAEVCGSIP